MMKKAGKQGSIMLVALGVLVCLFLFGGKFFTYMRMQQHLGHRGGERQLMGKVALALATLAIHKIQHGPETGSLSSYPAADSDLSDLYNFLSAHTLPATPVTKKLDLKKVLDYSLAPVVEPLTAQGDLVHEVSYTAQREDFESCGMSERGFPRERRGAVRINVKLTLNRGGMGNSIAEEFEFATRVKVTAALLPLVSKFSLMIEKTGPAAGAGSPFDGFNLTSVGQNGNLRGGTRARPIELYNGDGGEKTIQKTYEEFVKYPRGLVYLGGPDTLFLNLAYGELRFPDADSSEMFHLFSPTDSDAGKMYRTLAMHDHPDGGGKIRWNSWDLGFTDEVNPATDKLYGHLRSFYHLAFFPTHMASIFRLCGVQKRQSPTLVLGNVWAKYMGFRTATFVDPDGKTPKIGADGKKKHFTLDSFADEREMAAYRDVNPDFDPFMRAFLAAGTSEDRVGYNCFCFSNTLKAYKAAVPCLEEALSSVIAMRPFNQGLAFSANRGNDLDIFDGFPVGDRLRDLIEDPPPEKIHEIPPTLLPFVKDTLDLKNLGKLVGDLKAIGRFSQEFPASGEATAAGAGFIQAMGKRGLLLDGRIFAPNGWIYVRKPMTVKISSPLEFASNGGIILEDGDIVIEDDVIPTPSMAREKNLLYFVTLNGDIRIEPKRPGVKVQAGLLAMKSDGTGRIVFGTQPARIVGAMAMQKLYKIDADLESFCGPIVEYPPAMAALPNSVEPPNSEAPLLTYSFEPFPVLLP